MHFFLDPHFSPENAMLNSEESRHASRVLRLREGEKILIGDGNGLQFVASINQIKKDEVGVKILEKREIPKAQPTLVVAISPTKNSNRFEWFLEKATELGVDEIIPLISSRTERPRIKTDRAEKIVLNATKQSQRAFLPKIHLVADFSDLLEAKYENRLIAHCVDDLNRSPLDEENSGLETLILIGPEGDFTKEEIENAEEKGFKSVILSRNRLRTETAGILAVAMLRMPSIGQR
jgi:16S rRNA (uracil1498-N3)-methyltransferase